MICVVCETDDRSPSGKCRECNRQYQRKWLKKNRKVQNLRIKRNAEKGRERNRIWVLDYLSTHPCVDCGELDPIVLEFDHLRDKKFVISVAINSPVSLESLEKEINKCEVRCANCHRRKTAEQLGFWKFLQREAAG